MRVAATGDITFGSTPSLPPDAGRGMFAQVARFLQGDVVVGNLETTLRDGIASGTKCGAGSTACFSFRAPSSYAWLLSGAGFTVLNLANNHSYDFGAAGLSQTVAARPARAAAEHRTFRRDRRPEGRLGARRSRRVRAQCRSAGRA